MKKTFAALLFFTFTLVSYAQETGSRFHDRVSVKGRIVDEKGSAVE